MGIADEEVCVSSNGTVAMCGAMDRITNFLLYARQAFCNEPDARSGCSFWDSLTCTASILAATATCGLLVVVRLSTVLLESLARSLIAFLASVVLLVSIVDDF